jgi:hypothetical protein
MLAPRVVHVYTVQAYSVSVVPTVPTHALRPEEVYCRYYYTTTYYTCYPYATPSVRTAYQYLVPAYTECRVVVHLSLQRIHTHHMPETS